MASTLQTNQIRVITPTTEYTYTVHPQKTQLEKLQYLIHHTTHTPPQPAIKHPLTNKELTKHGIVGMGRERYTQAIKLGLHKPINTGETP